MIIVCDQCKTRFRLEDSAVNREIFKARCAKCHHIFVVDRRPPDETPLVLQEEQILPDANYKILTICNQKGGVAKTSTCINLGAALTLHGKRVLLVDFDVQANLSDQLGVSGKRSFYDVLSMESTSELSKVILRVEPNLFCLPSNNKMALLPKNYLSKKGFERILGEHLRRVASFFDYVLIDTPPSLDFFTINALMASDFAIITTQAEYLALKGVGHVENIIDVLRQKTGHQLDYKILINMYEPENTASQAVCRALKRRYPGHIFATEVTRDVKVQESQILRSSVIRYDPKASASRQYLALADEILRFQT